MSGKLPWPDILPLLLLQICCTPWAKIGFEILYGRPPPLVKYKGGPDRTREFRNKKQLQGLGKTELEIHRWVKDRVSIFLWITVHPHNLGDQVWIKEWKGNHSNLPGRDPI